MKRRLPPLLALRAFEAAGRHLSFSKAADELNVTQGAISRQIKLLEEFLDAPLFRRLTRQVELTPFGLSYLAPATQALDLIEQATVQSLEQARTLSVSLLPTIGTLWLMQRLTAFMMAYPEIRLQVSASLEPVNFKRDPVDVAIRVGKVPGHDYPATGSQITFQMAEHWADVSASLLWEDYITPVCSRAYLAEHGPIASVDDLARHRLIHNISRPDCWPAWLRASGRSGITGRARLEVGHSYMAVLAARSGQGIACVPIIETDTPEWRDELVCPFDLRLKSSGAYYLLCPTDKRQSPEVKLFATWLAAQYAVEPGGSSVEDDLRMRA